MTHWKPLDQDRDQVVGVARERRDVRRGLLLLAICHCGVLMVLMLLSLFISGPRSLQTLAYLLVSTIMFWQWFYVVPLLVILYIRRRMAMLRGVLLGALIASLISGASCFIFMALAL